MTIFHSKLLVYQRLSHHFPSLESLQYHCWLSPQPLESHPPPRQETDAEALAFKEWPGGRANHGDFTYFVGMGWRLLTYHRPISGRWAAILWSSHPTSYWIVQRRDVKPQVEWGSILQLKGNWFLVGYLLGSHVTDLSICISIYIYT